MKWHAPTLDLSKLSIDDRIKAANVARLNPQPKPAATDDKRPLPSDDDLPPAA